MINIIGMGAINLFLLLKHYMKFCFTTIMYMMVPRVYINNIYMIFVDTFMYSLLLIALTSTFTGMVLVIELYSGFSQYANEQYIGTIISLSMVRELIPVLIALVVNARVTSAFSAEIASMKVTEQIPALTILGINPIQYIVIPRIIGILLAMPLLILIGDTLSFLGAYIIANFKLGLNGDLLLTNMWDVLASKDIALGVIKGLLFALSIGFNGCYFGYYATPAAKGVGLATTNSVVCVAVSIFAIDYLVALFLLGS